MEKRGGEEMRDVEEIMRGALRGERIPDGYNLIESEAWGALRQIAVMYKRGEMSKEKASENKRRIYVEYEREAKEFELANELYKEYIERVIMKTENNRTKLRKMEGSDREKLEVCMEILEQIFPGELTYMKEEKK